ncbi:hypothetical protein Y032_0124g1215 [Ancylostoma ceylanicum]|uniref:Uncharacterized protein n=1 Tax=Ancylostoma ceylanicum TaxID=53326 RepID=A0A016T9A9_9BILA|nr:hypothetical protein Y032_0124g1215 [Ancylostoma ceylanicum]
MILRLRRFRSTPSTKPLLLFASLTKPSLPDDKPRWGLVVWHSECAQCVPSIGFRGGTRAHPATEHSSAPSTHGKERLHFLHFSNLSRSFISVYEFTVPKKP